MAHLFSDTFGINDTPLIFFCGDEAVEVLQVTLGRELSGQGKTVLLISDSPMPFPLEGQVLVDIHWDLLKQKINPQRPQVFYLCSEVKDNLLIPPQDSILNHFASESPENTVMLCQVKSDSPFLKLKSKPSIRPFLIQVFNYNSFEAHFNKFLNKTKSQAGISFEEHLKMHWFDWSLNFCPFRNEKINSIKNVLYVNQVKSLIDENQVISIVRNLADIYDHVYLGDINEYKLKEI